jgi:hypothetical protein
MCTTEWQAETGAHPCNYSAICRSELTNYVNTLGLCIYIDNSEVL